MSPLVQTLSVSEQIAPEGGERVASRMGGTRHIQVDRDWMRGARGSSSELTSWRLLQLLGISLLIWDCSVCISFAYICITRTWLAPEIEIPSLGNYVKKPLETSRNPGARETEAGSWMCWCYWYPFNPRSLHSFPNPCCRRGGDVSENGMGGATRLRIKSSLGAPDAQMELGTEHSHGGDGLNLVRAGLGVGMEK